MANRASRFGHSPSGRPLAQSGSLADGRAFLRTNILNSCYPTSSRTPRGLPRGSLQGQCIELELALIANSAGGIVLSSMTVRDAPSVQAKSTRPSTMVPPSNLTITGISRKSPYRAPVRPVAVYSAAASTTRAMALIHPTIRPSGIHPPVGFTERIRLFCGPFCRNWRGVLSFPNRHIFVRREDTPGVRRW